MSDESDREVTAALDWLFRVHDSDSSTARLGIVRQHIDRLTEAILDIDAHATPMGLLDNDDPDGSPHHYAVTVGALHRALGVVGHPAAKCGTLPCPRAERVRELAAEWAVSEERGWIANQGDALLALLDTATEDGA